MDVLNTPSMKVSCVIYIHLMLVMAFDSIVFIILQLPSSRDHKKKRIKFKAYCAKDFFPLIFKPMHMAREIKSMCF